MNFYEAQEHARRQTRRLGVGFALAVLGVMGTVGLFITFLLLRRFEFQTFGLSALGAAGVVLLPSLYKSLQLRRGGGIVATDLGGRLLDGNPSDFYEKRFGHVVEEMAIACGQPIPHLYVLDQEETINAFAAGTEPSNAVIAVTRGCLERLSREELQGVVAHEFSHILNGDMKLNMRLIGWVFGLMSLSIIGQILLRSLSYGRIRPGSSRDNGSGVLILVALGGGLLIIGSIGVFFGRMLQAAVSRQREFLADASAVQFTRNPESIAGALERIGGLEGGSRLKHPKAGEASHLFLADGGLFSYGFATHPPLGVRIRRIRKDWDGRARLSSTPPPSWVKRQKFPLLSAETPRMSPRAQGASKASFSPAPLRPFTMQEGHRLRREVPEELVQAAHQKKESQLLLFCLLLNEKQLDSSDQRWAALNATPAGQEFVARHSAQIAALTSLQKMACIDLAIPTLRRLSTEATRRFMEQSRQFISQDGGVTLFEYLLQRMIERHLLRHHEGASFSSIKYHRSEEVAPYFERLFELMQKAQANTQVLTVQEVPLLDDLLDRAEKASPVLKKELIDRLLATAMQDKVLNDREGELLRITAEAIGCTIPFREFLSQENDQHLQFSPE